MSNREEFFQILLRLDYLISRRSTGPADNLASRIGVSPRTLKQYIKYMRQFGAPIIFSKSKSSYVYHPEGKFKICFEAKKGITDTAINFISNSHEA